MVLFHSLKFEEAENMPLYGFWERNNLSYMRHSYIGLDTGLHKLKVAKELYL